MMGLPAPFGDKYGPIIGDRACRMCGVHIWFTPGQDRAAIPRTADGTNHFQNCPGVQKKPEPKQQTLFDVGRKFEYPR